MSFIKYFFYSVRLLASISKQYYVWLICLIVSFNLYSALHQLPLFQCHFFFIFWLHCTACGILVLWPGIEHRPSAVRAQSPNHWTAREFPMPFIYLFIYFFKELFIYLFLAVLGLRFCARALSSCGERGPLFITVRRPLTIAASLVAEHRLQTRRLSSCGSRT